MSDFKRKILLRSGRKKHHGSSFVPWQKVVHNNLAVQEGYMTPEQAARMTLGWSREQLARESGVSVASIHLLERNRTAGPDDDARIREALVYGLMQRWADSRPLLNWTHHEHLVSPESNE